MSIGVSSRLYKYNRLKALPVRGLVIAAIIAISTVALCFLTRSETKNSYYEKQLQAAKLMQKCEVLLKDYIVSQEIEIEEEDINQTGLIGPEYSELVSTVGHIDAKRSALDPNMAALIVKYINDAGLESGDSVAVGSSSSFPGLAIATICACTVMDMDTRLIVSYGSSNYGGTRPELPLIKMLKLLRSAGLVEFDLYAVSPGGDNDHGVGALDGFIYENTRDLVVSLAMEEVGEGTEFIDLNSTVKSIERRLELYGDDVDLFINVGGAGPNMGLTMEVLNLPNGLVFTYDNIPSEPDRGLMFEYLERGVPIVNLLYVKRLCFDNGIDFDPSPLTEPGVGGVYYHLKYNSAIALVGLILTCLILLFMKLRSHKLK